MSPPTRIASAMKSSSRTSSGSLSLVAPASVVILPLNPPVPMTASRLSVPSNISITSGWSTPSIPVHSKTRSKSLSSQDVDASDQHLGVQTATILKVLAKVASRTSEQGADVLHRTLPTLKESVPSFGGPRSATSVPDASSRKHGVESPAGKAALTVAKLEASEMPNYDVSTPSATAYMAGSEKPRTFSELGSDNISRERGMLDPRLHSPGRGYTTQFQQDQVPPAPVAIGRKSLDPFKRMGEATPTYEHLSLEPVPFCFSATTAAAKSLGGPPTTRVLFKHITKEEITPKPSPFQQQAPTATERMLLDSLKKEMDGRPARDQGFESIKRDAFGLTAISKPATRPFEERPTPSDFFARSKVEQIISPAGTQQKSLKQQEELQAGAASPFKTWEMDLGTLQAREPTEALTATVVKGPMKPSFKTFFDTTAAASPIIPPSQPPQTMFYAPLVERDSGQLFATAREDFFRPTLDSSIKPETKLVEVAPPQILWKPEEKAFPETLQSQSESVSEFHVSPEKVAGEIVSREFSGLPRLEEHPRKITTPTEALPPVTPSPKLESPVLKKTELEVEDHDKQIFSSDQPDKDVSGYASKDVFRAKSKDSSLDTAGALVTRSSEESSRLEAKVHSETWPGTPTATAITSVMSSELTTEQKHKTSSTIMSPGFIPTLSTGLSTKMDSTAPLKSIEASGIPSELVERHEVETSLDVSLRPPGGETEDIGPAKRGSDLAYFGAEETPMLPGAEELPRKISPVKTPESETVPVHVVPFFRDTEKPKFQEISPWGSEKIIPHTEAHAPLAEVESHAASRLSSVPSPIHDLLVPRHEEKSDLFPRLTPPKTPEPLFGGETPRTPKQAPFLSTAEEMPLSDKVDKTLPPTDRLEPNAGAVAPDIEAPAEPYPKEEPAFHEEAVTYSRPFVPPSPKPFSEPATPSRQKTQGPPSKSKQKQISEPATPPSRMAHEPSAKKLAAWDTQPPPEILDIGTTGTYSSSVSDFAVGPVVEYSKISEPAVIDESSTEKTVTEEITPAGALDYTESAVQAPKPVSEFEERKSDEFTPRLDTQVIPEAVTTSVLDRAITGETMPLDVIQQAKTQVETPKPVSEREESKSEEIIPWSETHTSLEDATTAMSQQHVEKETTPSAIPEQAEIPGTPRQVVEYEERISDEIVPMPDAQSSLEAITTSPPFVAAETAPSGVPEQTLGQTETPKHFLEYEERISDEIVPRPDVQSSLEVITTSPPFVAAETAPSGVPEQTLGTTETQKHFLEYEARISDEIVPMPDAQSSLEVITTIPPFVAAETTPSGIPEQTRSPMETQKPIPEHEAHESSEIIPRFETELSKPGQPAILTEESMPTDALEHTRTPERAPEQPPESLKSGEIVPRLDTSSSLEDITTSALPPYIQEGIPKVRSEAVGKQDIMGEPEMIAEPRTSEGAAEGNVPESALEQKQRETESQNQVYEYEGPTSGQIVPRSATQTELSGTPTALSEETLEVKAEKKRKDGDTYVPSDDRALTLLTGAMYMENTEDYAPPESSLAQTDTEVRPPFLETSAMEEYKGGAVQDITTECAHKLKPGESHEVVEEARTPRLSCESSESTTPRGVRSPRESDTSLKRLKVSSEGLTDKARGGSPRAKQKAKRTASPRSPGKSQRVPTPAAQRDADVTSQQLVPAISESQEEFMDLPVQVNMVIDVMPPRSGAPPMHALLTPMHAEKQMILENLRDGHVQLSVPAVYIETPDGRHLCNEPIHLSVSVDLGKKSSRTTCDPSAPSSSRP